MLFNYFYYGIFLSYKTKGVCSYDCFVFLLSFTTSGRPDNPGNATFHVARAARTRRTWCWMSSCSFGTLANLARLPISDVVVRSRTKLGEIVRVSDGVESVAEGGLTLI